MNRSRSINLEVGEDVLGDPSQSPGYDSGIRRAKHLTQRRGATYEEQDERNPIEAAC